MNNKHKLKYNSQISFKRWQDHNKFKIIIYKHKKIYNKIQ